jgi:YgiT-type zinc finger domain-containing protein
MKNDLCPVCGGIKSESGTSFTVDYKIGVVVIRDVPATVCQQCGEEWISDAVSEKLEQIVNIAKQQKQEILVANFNSYSRAS